MSVQTFYDLIRLISLALCAFLVIDGIRVLIGIWRDRQ